MPDHITLDGKTFETYTQFPAFFQHQASKTGSTSGEIDIKLSVPVEGRGNAITLMDAMGEELQVIVMRRVFGVDDGDEG